MSKESDKKFFTLFTLVVVALSILMITFFFLGGKYGGNPTAPLNINKTTAEAPKATEEPATDIAMATEATPAEEISAELADASEGIDGKAIYDKVCVACHAGAIPGIPKLGEKSDWEARIAQGKDVLYDHALNGFMGVSMQMPPRGGAELSDDEVKAAVDYMVQSAQ